MKKIAIVLSLLLLIGKSAVFAGDSFFSLGGGAAFDWSFRNGIEANGKYIGDQCSNYGVFLFVDIKYIEIEANLAYGIVSGVFKGGGTSALLDLDNRFQFGLNLLGKYPFTLGPISLFPLLGIGGNLVLPGAKITDLSQFGLLGGAGLDLKLGKSLFLRGEGLFQLRLPNSQMEDLSKTLSDATDNFKATWAMGPRVKLGLGYRF